MVRIKRQLRITRILVTPVVLLAGMSMLTPDSGLGDDRIPAESKHAVVQEAKFSPDVIAFFESNVRPLLAKHCFKCHGPDNEAQAGLRVDSLRRLLKGGESGPTIVPGDPDKSLLINVVNYGEIYQMPPDGKLPKSEIDILTRWVKNGAVWPNSHQDEAESHADDSGGVLTEERMSHWSFQPVVVYEPPHVTDESWPESPIDSFVLAKLEEAGLKPAPPADRQTLLRRVTFDLTGLPPTPEDIEAFLADDSAQAFETVVERLLSSSHYGERWGRHWLDVARYADATGHESDHVYRLLWRYRDYVIDALNNDKPYDQFIVEQLAGDLLPKTADRAENLEHVIATGFLQAGPKPASERDKKQMLTEIVDEQLNTTGVAFLGLTLGCARCHDHKFDPVPARDYYSLAGIFMSTDTMADRLPDSMWVEYPMEGTDGRVVPVMAVRDEKKPANMPVYLRGNYKTPGEEAPRRFLQAIAGEDHAPIKTDGSGRLELARWIAGPDHPLTARVMVNRIWQNHFGIGIVATSGNFGLQSEKPSHPELLDFLATKFVKSGWSIKAMHRMLILSSTYRQKHAENPEAMAIDAGNRLLWRMPRRRLSVEEIRDGMLAVSGELDDRMGGTLLLYRDGWGRPRRYPDEGTKTYKVSNYGIGMRHKLYPAFERPRRTVYLPRPRLLESEFSQLFDGPDASFPVARRDESTVAPQSLFFMNSNFAEETSQQFARRLLKETSDEVRRIEHFWLLTFGREPQQNELQRDREFLANYAQQAGVADTRELLPDEWSSYDKIVSETEGLAAYYRLNKLHEEEDISRPHVAVNSASLGKADGVFVNDMKWIMPGSKKLWPDGIYADVAFGRWGAIDLDAPLGRRNTAVGFNMPYEWPFDDRSDTGVDRGHRMQVDDVETLSSETGELTVEYWLQPINLWAGMVIGRDDGCADNSLYRSGIDIREVDGVKQNVIYYEIFGEGNGGKRCGNSINTDSQGFPSVDCSHTSAQ